MKQQEINKQLDLDKSDMQAEVNDNTPPEEEEKAPLTERLAVESRKGSVVEAAAYTSRIMPVYDLKLVP